MSETDPQDEPKDSAPAPPAGRFGLTEREWTVILTLVVLFVTVLSFLRMDPSDRSDPAEGPGARGGKGARLSSEKVPLVTGQEPIQEMFTKAGCPVCHNIPGITGGKGRVGPALVLRKTAPQRLADPGYRGKAETVREYIEESILAPGVYVVPGYPDRAMPRWYGKKLTAQALDRIAAYLETLSD